MAHTPEENLRHHLNKQTKEMLTDMVRRLEALRERMALGTDASLRTFRQIARARAELDRMDRREMTWNPAAEGTAAVRRERAVRP